MADEKSRVLDMLNEGKITADEAVKLIEALGGGPRFISKERREDMEEKIHQFAKDVKRFAGNTGEKIKVIYHDVEPKVKEATKNALEKLASGLDGLAKKLNESLEKDCCCCDEVEEKCCDDKPVDCCEEECDKPADNGPRPDEKQA